LAFKAFDSYVDIITRGKDRVDKSGEADGDIDSDGTVLRTSAEAIRMICRFGSRHEAEKALEIGHDIERWLEQSEHNRTASDAGSVASTDAAVEPEALAIAYCAIGVSQAHWARYTYEVEKRAEHQAKAVQYLRRSLSPGLGDSNNVDALYALALVLAETRDIPGAIKVVKSALSSATRNQTAISTDGVLSSGVVSEYGKERKLIPLWHLLALLLTSRADCVAAEKACEAAFEQFGDPAVLFGKDDESAFRSELLNQNTGKDVLGQGLVDSMESFEKSGILQIKMTQLALVETIEGSIAAVDGCNELIALYGRLFGDPSGERVKFDTSTTAVAPTRSAIGTVRGSIFHGRGSVKTSQTDSPTSLGSKGSTAVTQSGAAPAISVTEDDGTTHANGHHRHHLFHHHKQPENQTGVARSGSKLQKRSSASLRRQSLSGAEQSSEVPPLPDNTPNSPPAHTTAGSYKSPRRSSMSSNPRKSVESGERTLRPIAHNMNHDHNDQPPKQDVRLHAPVPHAGFVPLAPRFSKLQERRQKVSLLVDVWIFISGLYSRAQMFQDAREAAAEAMKLVEAFEIEASQDSSTAKSLAEKGWGAGKSVEELWADAFTAVSPNVMEIPSLANKVTAR
jgi:hypothetical protein